MLVKKDSIRAYYLYLGILIQIRGRNSEPEKMFEANQKHGMFVGQI